MKKGEFSKALEELEQLKETVYNAQVESIATEKDIDAIRHIESIIKEIGMDKPIQPSLDEIESIDFDMVPYRDSKFFKTTEKEFLEMQAEDQKTYLKWLLNQVASKNVVEALMQNYPNLDNWYITVKGSWNKSMLVRSTNDTGMRCLLRRISYLVRALK